MERLCLPMPCTALHDLQHLYAVRISDSDIAVQVAYYDSLNTLVLFIMLGIGADTIFVYFDAFRQSDLLPEHCESRDTRLLYTVRRAASATLVTSLTTALAFLATSLSRLSPIAAFGIFAFTCMVVLYITSTLLIPPGTYQTLLS